jgi:peptide/nickel transport system substrate-binding protein
MPHLREAGRIAAIGLLVALGALVLRPHAAAAESVLRIAMTAGDIPDWAGEPDQGFEGFRFVGFTLYDGLVNWDLSHSDREADIRPALATKWFPDPANPKKWIFELRHDVKFHDDCAWNADAAVWNFERLTQKTSPAFSPLNYARARSAEQRHRSC